MTADGQRDRWTDGQRDGHRTKYTHMIRVSNALIVLIQIWSD